MYGRAATKVRGCPPEGVAGLSELWGCPPEGIADHDHVTEGFPPLGRRFKYKGRERYERSHMVRL